MKQADYENMSREVLIGEILGLHERMEALEAEISG